MLLSGGCVAVTIGVVALPGAGRLDEVIRGNVDALVAGLGAAWALTGAVLAWLRPRNALGWLLLFVGACQALSVALSAYGGYGIAVADPAWPVADWAVWIASAIWLPGLLPLGNLLLALYPDGRLPNASWRLPAAAAAVGVVLLTAATLLDPQAYSDIAPGPSPLSARGPARVLAWAAAGPLLGGTLTIWVMSAVRLVRARPPERQQLAWLFFVVVPFLALLFVDRESYWVGVTGLSIPVAVGVGVFRYNLLGIEIVLRRGLLYGALTGVVAAVYFGATAIAGSRPDRGPLPGVVAAALVAVGLTPLRERLQGGIDRLVYGDRRDPMRAVTRLGDRVAAAEEADLLPAVLATVTAAVRAPGASVLDDGGRVLATEGSTADGATLPLRVSGRSVGGLHVAARAPGEAYSQGDRRLLAALAPQVAAVVRALGLAEALEAERDRVVAATRVERDRLRRDLHDGLGPSLSGVGLGLQALDDATAAGDGATAAELLCRIREEVAAAVGEVRQIIDGLRPAVLDGVGLAAAVRRHADAVAAGVQVDLDVADLPPLPPGVETAAYRIAQEALTNVVRHAGARRVRVTLVATGGVLTVEVADDGAGIRSPGGEGVGLSSMRQRAETLGGTLGVATGDSGTTVVATLPLGRLST